MPSSSSSSTSPFPPHDHLSTRKRQRSQSMQSEPSSSSPKRAASEDPTQDTRTPPRGPISVLSHSGSGPDDIDSYMADQGDPPLRVNPSVPDPSPAQKLASVDALLKEPMRPGETWYVVSRRWYKRWQKACSGEVDKDGPVLEQDLGPVDNSPLVNSVGNFVSNAVEHVDVEFLPETAWLDFVKWYGEPTYTLPRKVIVRGIAQEAGLELHPPHVKLHVLTPIIVDDVPVPPPDVTISIKDTIKSVCQTFATRLTKASPSADAAQDSRPFRVWKLAEGSWDQAQCSVEMLKQRGAVLMEPSEKLAEDELIEPGDAFAVEFQAGDKWLVDPSELPGQANLASSSTSQSLATDGTLALFSRETDFFSEVQAKAPSTSTKAVPVPSTLRPAAPIRAGPVASRSKGPAQDPGLLGLGNMGNTCFMNSALQCLAHTQELVDYFLAGVFEDELNPDNPLGMGGAIAEAFGALLRRIWGLTPSGTSYSPREFKSALQRFAPQFSGYQQHDSQELVAFLLDGLHEDLNRVHKKPYVEKPDWQNGGDKELAELANESWQGYMKRNDSVIVDLFQGQYQSTLVCPECQKVSITFDPFMYLTLPLPVQKKWRHTVFYVPWDLSKPHVKVPIEINRDASFKDLRQLLGRWMETNPDNLLTLEVFGHRFYKDLDDTCLCGDMSDTDTIVCFELPCHAQQNRNYKPHPDDPFIVPVVLSDLIPVRQSFARNSLFGYPFFIVVDRQQAASVDTMYDAVLERLQRWTANIRDLFAWEVSSSSSMEEVHIPINGLPPVETVTEFKANGDVVTVEQAVLEEGDIADEKGVVIQGQEFDVMDTDDEPRKVGFKKDIFRLTVQAGNAKYGIGYGSFGASGHHVESWEQREAAATSFSTTDEPAVLLREHDVLFCEFDENVKAYYFGDEKSHWEHARWTTWDEHIHPDYSASRAADAAKSEKGITLQDCLDEFTREEKLGEDDLWYCPRCKKHQQATKRFDLWKVPDVLVVHLKRFSNSRTLRDKIDTFVDFPVEGLDLSKMVGERQVATRLKEEGFDIEQLGLHDLEEQPIYDLYAVDEHLGGLGGGHYRAYALNHTTGRWYHFDDSYVTQTKPDLAVNANAYLLFYKRRTSRPLGGKSFARIEAARNNLKTTVEPRAQDFDQDSRLTPPLLDKDRTTSNALQRLRSDPVSKNWSTMIEIQRSSPASSSSPLDDVHPPSFEDSQYDGLLSNNLDPLAISAHQFDFPDPSSSRNSPTSSNEAEPDLEPDLDLRTDEAAWSPQYSQGALIQNTQFSHSSASSPEASSAEDIGGQWQSDDEREEPMVQRVEGFPAVSLLAQDHLRHILEVRPEHELALDSTPDIDMYNP